MATNILLASGLVFDFRHPERCQFGIMDIAHALAHICRFTGHTRRFYSVAQHSVWVSRIVPPEDALAGLLPDYQALEKQIEAVVFARFGLPPELPASVKRADLVMLATEKRALMPTDGRPWQDLNDVQPLAIRLDPKPPVTARVDFFTRYNEIIRRQS